MIFRMALRSLRGKAKQTERALRVCEKGEARERGKAKQNRTCTAKSVDEEKRQHEKERKQE